MRLRQGEPTREHACEAWVPLDPTARLLFGLVGLLVDQTLASIGRRSKAEDRARLAGPSMSST
jgi:hypothetical protein